jgi:Peptidase family M23/SprB repeat/Abnormal spindle-like microcephaly-assoc'd, ASPM-SPD-2-Hydin/S-layer homology domain
MKKIIIISNLILFITNSFAQNNYKLPFVNGTTVKLSRSTQHAAPLEGFAYDFVGVGNISVVASRSGCVRKVKSNSNVGGNSSTYKNDANYVVITHNDGTEALYMHFTYNSILVNTGDFVIQGQPLGIMGSTGYSTAPHLHFQVQSGSLCSETNLTWYKNSIETKFCDVNINNGIPDVAHSPYVAGNGCSDNTINYKQPIFCGTPSSPTSGVPVIFQISSGGVTVSNISDIAIVNYDGDNDPNNDVIKRTCTLLPSSIKNCDNKNWQFKFSINGPAYSWDVNTKYTLRFKVTRSDNQVGYKYAKEQITFRNATGFTDLSQPFYKCYVENGIKNAFFSGKSQTAFDPNGYMTRGEMAKVIINTAVRLGEISGNTSAVKQFMLSNTNGEFTDVNSDNSWYPYVQTLRNAGALSDFVTSNSFQPNTEASIGLFCKVASKVFNINSTNTNDFKKVVSKIIVSDNANPLYKIYMNYILGTYAKATCNATNENDEEATIAVNEFLNNNVSQSATIYGTEKIKRKAMARMINGLYYYCLSRQGGNNGSRSSNNLNTLANNNTKTIIGSKHEVEDGYSNTLIHPFSLGTSHIGISDSLIIGTNSTKDNNGNEIYFYWVLNKGTLIEKTSILNKVVFHPDNMQIGDTARLYSFVANNLGQYSAGEKLIIIGNSQPPTTGVNINLSSNNLNFGSVNVGANITQTFIITNPASSSNMLNGNVAISGIGYTIQTGAGSFSLAAGASKTITIKFTPTIAGNASGAVSITHNASNLSSPSVVNLSGTGVGTSGGTSSAINCNTTNILSCGTSNIGTTVGKINTISSYCGSPNNYTAKDDTWKYTPNTSGIVNIYFWSIAPLKLFVFANCTSTASCLKTIDNGYTQSINVTAGQTYYFIVDGVGSVSGQYEIKPSCPIQTGGSGTLGADCPTFSPSPLEITQQFTQISALHNSTVSAHQGTVTISGADKQYFKWSNNINDTTRQYSLSGYNSWQNDLWFDYNYCTDPEREYFAELKIHNNSSLQNSSGAGPCNNVVKIIPIHADTRRAINWSSPSSGSQYIFGQQSNIQYSYPPNPSSDGIFNVSIDGGATWLPTYQGNMLDSLRSITGNNTINFYNNPNDPINLRAIPYGTRYGKMRVKESGCNTARWYETAGYFTIRQSYNFNNILHFTSPEIQDEFTCGTAISLKWRQFMITGLLMQLSFSKNGGRTWAVQDTIATIQGNNTQDFEYTFSWTPPSGLSTDSLIFKVKDLSFGYEDESDGLSKLICNVQPVLNVSSTFNNPSCATANNGNINLAVTGGSTNYALSWTKNGSAIPNTGLSLTNMGVGNYSYLINDGAGLTANGNIVLSANNPLILSMTATPSLCTNNNGTANVLVTGGSGNYTYLWSNNSNSNAISNVSTGSHSVLVTDNTTSCSQTNLVYVSNTGSTISLGFNSPPNICIGATTSVVVTALGGTAPYTYRFDNLINTTNAKQCAVGFHTINVTDANGCSGIGTIEVKENPEIFYTLEVNDAICSGQGSAKVIANGGTGLFQYKWDNNSFQANNIITLDTGRHTINIFDGICNKIDTFYINYARPEAYFESSSIEVELGDTAVHFQNYSYGNSSQKWYYDEVQQSTTINYQKVFTSVGTHEIKLVIYNNTCTDTSKQIITVYPQLLFSTTILKEICNNGRGKILVNALGGKPAYNYSLDSNSWRATNIFDSLQSGNYMVWLRDSKNKIIKSTVVILDSVSIINSNAIIENVKCYGNSNGKITLNPTNGTNPFKYLWSSSINDTLAILNNLNIGNYFVKITDTNGCIKLDTFSISQPDSIKITAIITNATCIPNGKITTTIIGGTGAYTYLWSNAATTQSLTNIGGGSYTLTVTDANACSKQKTFVVIADTRLKSNGVAVDTINVTYTPIVAEFCDKDSIKLNVPLYNDLTYQWYKDGSVIANATTNSIWVTQQGQYKCLLKDANTCNKFSNLLSVIKNALPDTALTINGNITLCGTQTTELKAIQGYANYLWSNGITTYNNIINTTGNYYVDITTLKGCKARSRTIAINQFASPQVSISPSGNITKCQGDSVMLTATSGYTSYVWNVANTANQNMYKVKTSGIYNVKVTDVNGCQNTSANTNITFNPSPPKPTISLSGTNILVCDKSGFSYNWQKWKITTLGNGVETYAPSLTTNGLNAGSAKEITVNTEKGLFMVTIGNGFSCKTASDTFRFIPVVSPILHVSPNPTSSNLIVYAEGVESNKKYDIVVYDAAGRQLDSKQMTATFNEIRTSFDLSKYAAATYIVALREYGGTKTLASIKAIKN